MCAGERRLLLEPGGEHVELARGAVLQRDEAVAERLEVDALEGPGARGAVGLVEAPERARELTVLERSRDLLLDVAGHRVLPVALSRP